MKLSMNKEDEKKEEEVVEEVEEKEEDKVEEPEEDEKDDLKALAKKLVKMVSAEAEANQKVINEKKAKLYAEPKAPEFADKNVKILEFVKALIAGDKTKIQPLSEGVAANGGFLVPEEWANMVVENKLDIAVLEPRCTVIPMTTDHLHLPALTSRPKVYWRSELAVKTTTTANWTELELTPYSKAAIITISDELVMDAQVGEASNIVAYLTRLLSEALVQEDERVIMLGTGTGQPTGISTYGIPALDAGGALNVDHVIATYHRLPMGYRSNACWIMSSHALELLRGLRDTTGQLIVAFNQINGSPVETLMGRPILETNKMLETEIYFGDLSYYYIGRRQGISVKVSDEATVASYSAFERDLVHIKAEERVDGELALVEAFRSIDNIS